jgi:DNA-binding CsgD family transcriptional regulator
LLGEGASGEVVVVPMPPGAFQATELERKLRAALAALEWTSEQDQRGVVLVDSSGAMEFASAAARRLMRDYFAASSTTDLPPALAAWVQSGSLTLVRRRGDRRLIVRRSGDALLLQEHVGELGLTARERQVVGWVACGKTNAEIAGLLWLSPGTVRRHLENIYGKLGVHNRAAAVAWFLGVRDAEG